MIAVIRYDAPVWVQVNTDTGEVERVQCGDAYAEPRVDDLQNDKHVIEDENGADVTDQAIRDHAIKIAGEVEWPAWEWA